MVTATKAKSSFFTRLGWLGFSLVVAAGGVTLNVTHARTDFTSYRSDEIEFAYRAMYFFIVLSGLCGALGAFLGYTWRVAAFGLAAPMVPVLCGVTFFFMVTFMYKLSAPAYSEFVTQGAAVEAYHPRLPANFHFAASPQRIHGSPQQQKQ